MGLFGHKKRVYVVWGRFDDAKDISGGDVIRKGLTAKEIAFVIEKISGEKYKPGDIRVVEDDLLTGYSAPLNQAAAKMILPVAWGMITSRFSKELFDKSKDVETHVGVCDLSRIGKDDYGLFLIYVYA